LRTSTPTSNIITSNVQPRSSPTHSHLFLSFHLHPAASYSQCILKCIPSQISPLSPEKHPAMFLRNSSYVPSAPTSYYFFHFHFCFTGRIDHRSGRQGLPLCALSIRSFPDFLSSYTSSKGGRLVTERRMVTDMYVFDLKTLVWEKVIAPPDDCTPAQRYFHSADSCECRFPRSCHPI
jgi:hypothetical protein